MAIQPPAAGGRYDAQSSIEHEIDEVLGLGSHINFRSDLRPQDLFSWSGYGVRNTGSAGARYFSINGGQSRIVAFNQASNGDFGDWLSASCPQSTPYVQNAFSCSGQVSDVTRTSPEGINLDVIGYDFAAKNAAPKTGDMNNDGAPDYVLSDENTGSTTILYLDNNVSIGSSAGPILPQGWSLAGIADFDHDGNRDYALFNSTSGSTAIWYLSGTTLQSAAYGPMLPPHWTLAAVGDFNGDARADFVLVNAVTRQTAIWYLNTNTLTASAYGPTLPPGWRLVAVADFNRDGQLDYLLYNSNTRASAIWYLSGAAFVSGAYGPTISKDYELVDVADFNGDGNPDYLLWNPVNGQTAIWYLSGSAFIGSAYGPSTGH
jgi:FG-GAP-like repeat